MILNKKAVLVLSALYLIIVSTSWRSETRVSGAYQAAYLQRLQSFRGVQEKLLKRIDGADLSRKGDIAAVRGAIREARLELKGLDFWMRYLEPIVYKKVNGPLPVEWETEVFEKFEKPYRREGAGLTLAYGYLEGDEVSKDSLRSLLQAAVQAMDTYAADSITSQLQTFHHFYLCNRLYLLNLAAIYTTGFECPEGEAVIPELRSMMAGTAQIYSGYNGTFPDKPLSPAYLALYDSALAFVRSQPDDYTVFDHFTFIRDYVNPLYTLNQQLILEHRVVSRSMMDYSLNKEAKSIFDKALYDGQSAKGIFRRVRDPEDLAEIGRIGKLLFYDPILSGNNQRACASCHKSEQYFADTALRTAFQFNHSESLPRNTPSLIGVLYNHLIMLDGKHTDLQHQGVGVISNAVEMNGTSGPEVLRKLMSCPDYQQAFTRFLKLTPEQTEVTMEHVASAITLYYAKFSGYYAPFDEAMLKEKALAEDARQGFNIFMGKAQCATCHFVPQFNGVKPPYVGSEFEVLGVPQDKQYRALSPDKGRWDVNPAVQTEHAFRTGTVRNAARTAPYMHNGVFSTLGEVIDFYDGGGGAGRGLPVPNQTLSSDSLHLSRTEKGYLLAFIRSLDENISLEAPPVRLPRSKIKALNRRSVGGLY